jgi:hypothetical protein
MAGIQKDCKDQGSDLKELINIHRYLKSFEKLGVSRQDLNFLTVYDLRYGLNVEKIEDCAVLMESFLNNEFKPVSLNLKITSKNQKFRKKIKCEKFSIGSHRNCDVFLQVFNFSHSSNSWQRPDVFCVIQFDQGRNFFYVTSTGHQQVFIKMPEKVELRDGMEFLMGINVFKVVRIWRDHVGNPIFCNIVKDGIENIMVGATGIIFGVDVKIDGISLRIHAAIQKDFVLENYGPVYELLKRGEAYPLYIGSTLIVDDYKIFFESSD